MTKDESNSALAAAIRNVRGVMDTVRGEMISVIDRQGKQDVAIARVEERQIGMVRDLKQIRADASTSTGHAKWFVTTMISVAAAVASAVAAIMASSG